MGAARAHVNNFFTIDALPNAASMQFMTHEAQTLIREWLAAEGRKNNWLAAQVPTRPQTLSAWLAGRYVPSPPARRRIQEITGLPVDDAEAWL